MYTSIFRIFLYLEMHTWHTWLFVSLPLGQNPPWVPGMVYLQIKTTVKKWSFHWTLLFTSIFRIISYLEIPTCYFVSLPLRQNPAWAPVMVYLQIEMFVKKWSFHWTLLFTSIFRIISYLEIPTWHFVSLPWRQNPPWAPVMVCLQVKMFVKKWSFHWILRYSCIHQFSESYHT